MRSPDISAAVCECTLDSVPDPGVRLFVRPPCDTAQEAGLLIDTVHAADDDTAAAGELVHLAVDGVVDAGIAEYY